MLGGAAAGAMEHAITSCPGTVSLDPIPFQETEPAVLDACAPPAFQDKVLLWFGREAIKNGPWEPKSVSKEAQGSQMDPAGWTREIH